jgi:hypothetical protein
MSWGASTWQLDWLTMDPHPDVRDANGVQWFATKVENFWGSPKSDVAFTPKIGRHGVFRVPAYKREKIVTITGRAYCPDDAMLRRAEIAVAGLLNRPDTEYPLICYSDMGNLACSVVLDSDIVTTPLDALNEPGFEFSIQVAAPDPRKYSLETRTMQTGLPGLNSASGLSFTGQGGGLDFSAGLHFGTPSSNGFLDLTNAGTAPVYPVLTLYGPLTNPTLTTNVGSVTYNGTLSATDYVVIDPAVPSVLLGGTASRRHLVSPASFTALLIPRAVDDKTPGTLRVGLSHTGDPGATGYLSAAVRSAWF